MTLAPGQKLGPYAITAPLGKGGMGEVWRATDTRLQRDVAIKVLPAEVTGDTARLARFEREAQLLAALNHPNIAAIHGLEEADGKPFLVLELVPGEDLSERLRRGPLPVDEAIEVARQVAEALEEAHERGVVHRDLKPANVKLTPDGKVKVLDFGLAKAWTSEAASGSAPDLSQSPTLAHTGTAAGMILGTAAYMSPEQARGKSVDKRSDVWAFGVLLHELLTGRPLFSGETVSDVLAAVLTREPDWAALPAATPAGVRRLLQRCLERDPRRRLRDIGEARIALSTPVEPPAPVEAGVPATRPRWLVPAALAAAALAFAAGYALRRPVPAVAPPVAPDTVLRQLTFEPGLEAEPSFSPDGNYVAYTTNDQGSLDVVVMPIAGGPLRRLAATPVDEAQPAWSPDGTQIAFTSAREHGGRLGSVNGLSALSTFVQGQGGDVFLAPAAGGPAVKLVERASFPAWSPDGQSIVFQSDRSGYWDIWTVSARGGEPRPLTNDADIDYQPSWSPDGKWVAYASVVRQALGQLKLVASDGSGAIRVVKVPAQAVVSPAWSPDGAWIYYAAGGTVTASTTSLTRVSVASAGAATPLVQRLTLGASADIDPDVAASGRRLAYGGVRYAPDLWVLDVASGALRQRTSTSCLEDYPDPSPDGRTLVFHSDRTSEARLYTLELDGGAWQPITEGRATMPRWSPDGRTVAYLRYAQDAVAIAVQAVGDLTVRELVSVPNSSGGLQGPVWAPDGKSVAYGHTTGDGWSIRVVGLAGNSREIAAPGGTAMFPTWSPDGRLVAFQREKDGPRAIWVAPVDGGEARAISSGTRELSHPQWSKTDPDRILVVVEHKNLGVLSVATGAVTPLTHYDDSTRYVDYPSWSRDGKQVYFSMTLKVGDLFLLESK
jgi:serine/threonine-protein kinase